MGRKGYPFAPQRRQLPQNLAVVTVARRGKPSISSDLAEVVAGPWFPRQHLTGASWCRGGS